MGEASYTADGGKRRCSSNAEMFLTEFRRATCSNLGSSPLNGAQQAYALLATKQKRDRGREGEKQMRESRKLMPKKTWSVMYTMSRKMYQFCVLARQLTRFARCLLYSKAWVQIRPNEMKSHSPFPKFDSNTVPSKEFTIQIHTPCSKSLGHQANIKPSPQHPHSQYVDSPHV
jgi:hypothetical protein